MKGRWSYDKKSGELRCGAKLVVHFYDDDGNPHCGKADEADRFGQAIADKMNEVQTKPHKPAWPDV